MHAVSEIVLRSQALLPAGELLLVNPPRDNLFRNLQTADREVRVSTQDFGDWRWLSEAGAGARFDLVPQPAPAANVIAFLPREKERLKLLLHALASAMSAEAELWLAGENRGGIKSSPRHLQRHFDGVEKIDSARHCGLFRATRPLPDEPFELDDYERAWTLERGELRIAIRSLPGVFAHGRLDPATAMLLEVLDEEKPRGKVLDFGCGAGVIGLSLLASGRPLDTTLLDSYSLALESSRRSLAANGLQAEVLASDGLGEVRGRYDWIVSNPAFHSGVESDYDIARHFFAAAGDCLAENGKILLVCNRHLPYEGWLQAQFQRVGILREDRAFKVIAAGGAKR